MADPKVWTSFDDITTAYTDFADLPDTARMAVTIGNNQYRFTKLQLETFIGALAAAGYQPLDSDLTAIAALTTTSFGRAFLAMADVAAARTALSVPSVAEVAAGYQPLDSDLTAIAALTTQSQGRGILEKATNQEIQSYLGIREILTANRTYYVTPATGSDSNDGLSSGTSFATLTKALNVAKTLDLNGYTLTISVSGAVTGNFEIPFLTGQASYTSFVIQGATGPTSDSIVGTGQTLIAFGGARALIKNLRVDSSGLAAINAVGGYVALDNVHFGTGMGASSYCIFANALGYVRLEGAGMTLKNSCGRVFNVEGNAMAHVVSGANSIKLDTGGGAITIPFFAYIWNNATMLTIGSVFQTISGSVTGQRYNVLADGLLQTFGAYSLSTFGFGSTNGATATGGQQL